MLGMSTLKFRKFIAHSRDLFSRAVIVRVAIVARAICERLCKRLLICHPLNRRRLKSFRQNLKVLEHEGTFCRDM